MCVAMVWLFVTYLIVDVVLSLPVLPGLVQSTPWWHTIDVIPTLVVVGGRRFVISSTITPNNQTVKNSLFFFKRPTPPPIFISV